MAASTPAAPDADAPAKRKHASHKHDRSGDFAAYRDGPYAGDHRGPVENGYPYGVRPGEARAERRDWQRQWSGGDFGQNRWRF